MPITQITVPMALSALRAIEKRSTVETARRVRQRMSGVSFTAEARALLEAVETVPAHPVTRVGHRMLALTGVRCAAIYGATRAAFQGLGGVESIWRFPKERMKGRTGSSASISCPWRRKRLT